MSEQHGDMEVHVWNRCHNCDAKPIAGKRYQCKTCRSGPDNDLCEACYALLQKNEISHPADDSPAHTIETGNHQFKQYDGKPILLYKDWLSVDHPDVPSPSININFMVRPIFNSRRHSSIGGYAFVVKLPDLPHPVLLTAFHIMHEFAVKHGIDCTDRNKGYTGKEIPDIIVEVDLFDLFASNWMLSSLGTAGPMLVLPNARIDDEEPCSDRDIAAFWALNGDKKLIPGVLAPNAPKVGEPVWLLAGIGEKQCPKMLKAVVVELTSQTFIFKFENKPADSDELKYTSGAPLINQNSEVVAINAGSGYIGSQKIGHGNHVENIFTHLHDAT